jgi:hypothetical protein
VTGDGEGVVAGWEGAVLARARVKVKVGVGVGVRVGVL